MPLYAGKYAICTFLQNMRNMLQSHDRYKPVSLDYVLCVTGSAVSGAGRGRHSTQPSSPTRTAATLPGKLFSPAFQPCSNHISV